MLKTLCALAVLLAVAHAATDDSALPTSSLESFLESGAHSEAEIDAMAQAMLGASLDSEMPRDTKMQKLHEKQAARAAAAAEAAAKRAPVPPPKPAVAAAAGAAASSAVPSVTAAVAAVPSGDRDDIIKLVYEELQRLGSAAAIPGAPGAAGAAPSLGVSDPRINTLEHRLSTFEKLRVEQANQVQDKAISAITSRLEGLDKTLSALRKSAQQQQALSSQLLRANNKQPATASSTSAKGKGKGGKKGKKEAEVDYSVSYTKAKLPADFDKKVQQILNSVKSEARKIYERYCKRAGITPQPEPPVKPTKKPTNAVEAAKQELSKAEKLKTKILKKAAAPKEAAAASAPAPASKEEAAPTPAPASAPAPAAAKKGGAIMMKPIIAGKEPTPEGMRLSKALNDISKALPITPAYQLGKGEQALQDVLGEGAVSSKWKTPRL